MDTKSLFLGMVTGATLMFILASIVLLPQVYEAAGIADEALRQTEKAVAVAEEAQDISRQALDQRDAALADAINMKSALDKVTADLHACLKGPFL